VNGSDIEDRKRAEERVLEENLALREEIDKTLMFERSWAPLLYYKPYSTTSPK